MVYTANWVIICYLYKNLEIPLKRGWGRVLPLLLWPRFFFWGETGGEAVCCSQFGVGSLFKVTLGSLNIEDHAGLE